MINPAGIPTIPGDMDALAGHAAALGGVGSDFADTGTRVNATWQGLGGVYDAPEAAQLLAATAPVQTLSASVGHDIGTVATALSAYAAEVREIKTQLTMLSSQASAFVDENGGSDDWRSDDAKVERNKNLVADVNAQLAAFYEAQRRCANTINALYGGPQYTADNGDGQHQPGEYGYTADQLNAAAREDGALPWGSVDERDRGLLGDIGAFCGGIKDGAVGFVTGLGALIGRDPTTGSWSWATAGTAWQGLGTFALAVGVYAVPGGRQFDQTIGIPGFGRGAMGDTLLTAGKSIIAYDEWGNDPARAAGMATFNIVSAIVGTKGATAGLRAAGTAAQGSRVAVVSATGTAMVRTSEAISRMPTVSELTGRATARLPGLHLPNLSNTAHLNIPHHVDIPTSHTHVGVPTGAHLPDTPPHPGTVGDALSHTPAGHSDAGSIHHADIPGQRVADTAPEPAPAHVNGHADSPTELRPHADLQPHTGADHPPSSHDPSPGSHATADDHGHDAQAPDPHSPDTSPVGALPERFGNQPDGSWTQVDHGKRFDLTPEQNVAADRYLGTARADEIQISPQVHSIADNIDGGRLQGYPKYVLKDEDSFKRKLADGIEDNPTRPLADVLADVKDSVRYTIEIPSHNYVAGFERALGELHSRGFENVTYKPTWENPAGYKGLNTTWRDPATGRIFELQFHTPESFAAKMETHDLYKAQRVATTPAERQHYADAQAEAFSRVPVPDGAVERLNDLRHEVAATRPGATPDGALSAAHPVDTGGEHRTDGLSPDSPDGAWDALLGGLPEGKWHNSQSYDNVIRTMNDAGVGSRGVVYIARPNGTAQVFNVINTEDGVVFLDRQTGSLGILESNVTTVQLYLYR